MLKLLLRRAGLLFPAVLFATIATAQGTCSQLVERALQEANQNCTGLGRNEACYGYNRVEASFIAAVEDDFFSTPADKTGVAEIATIRTAPLDEDNDQWGVAVMSLQANLPNTIPGQNVTFILLGDTEVENAVGADTAFVPSDGIEVTVTAQQGANIRSGPGTNFNVVGGTGTNSTLQADGLSVDGAWLRVAYNDRPAWISRSVIGDDPAIAELPALTEDLRTPMQAFYLRTGIGQPVCEEAPDDILLVQGPEDIQIELTVNGANIELGSSGALRTVEIDGQLYLEIIVFDGEFEVDGRVIRAGQHSLMCLGNQGSRGLDGEANDLVVTCGASVPETIDYDIFGEDWCVLEDVPGDLLNYGLDILCPGETLPSFVPDTPSGATASQNDAVDCSTFSRIGPDSVAATVTTFLWTEAPGATDYEIVFYNFQGGVAQTFFTQATNITLNVGEIPTGSELSWEVRAFRNGEYACVTFRSPQSVRGSDPNEPVGGYNVVDELFRATWTCGLNGDVVVNYTRAPEGTTGITFSYTDMYSTNTNTYPASAGSGWISTYSYGAPQYGGYLIALPSGARADIPGTLNCMGGY